MNFQKWEHFSGSPGMVWQIISMLYSNGHIVFEIDANLSTRVVVFEVEFLISTYELSLRAKEHDIFDTPHALVALEDPTLSGGESSH